MGAHAASVRRLEDVGLRVFRELAVILCLAVVPIVISYAFGGTDLLIELSKSMMAHKWIMIYSMVGFAFFIVVSFLEWHVLVHSNRFKKAHRLTSEVLHEVASSFLGILRISSGIFISVFCLWLFFDFSTEMLPTFASLLLFGTVAAVECVAINWALEYAQKNWSRDISNQLL
ncbi:hypothetical protein FE848_18390 [Marinobacter sp. 1-3A]|uniref:hypothetical protein n=1 Tax=Marinobacter sp. 1-3A TaxID=2582920 RepID=UPI001905EF6B|nr:hypothetical protein [Marinobacter sp. 1-3A]MBK1875186.1 hypothetical protein [Marinobacter sp. 1-3A]